ncbi:hypothetical protein K438DRAFT_959017 [Mycena galopus ATCC 62051]|nr:hypothetical protein K438DRAFT_959017 [Mycena galopus ATCC 62051]
MVCVATEHAEELLRSLQHGLAIDLEEGAASSAIKAQHSVSQPGTLLVRSTFRSPALGPATLPVAHPARRPDSCSPPRYDPRRRVRHSALIARLLAAALLDARSREAGSPARPCTHHLGLVVTAAHRCLPPARRSPASPPPRRPGGQHDLRVAASRMRTRSPPCLVTRRPAISPPAGSTPCSPACHPNRTRVCHLSPARRPAFQALVRCTYGPSATCPAVSPIARAAILWIYAVPSSASSSLPSFDNIDAPASHIFFPPSITPFPFNRILFLSICTSFPSPSPSTHPSPACASHN